MNITKKDRITGRELKALRKAAGITLSEAAERCNCHHSYIYMIEVDKRAPSNHMLDKMIECYMTAIDSRTVEFLEVANANSLLKSFVDRNVHSRVSKLNALE